MAAQVVDPLESSLRPPRESAPVAQEAPPPSCGQGPAGCPPPEEHHPDAVAGSQADFQAWLKAPHGPAVDSALASFESSTGLNRDQLVYVFASLLVLYMMFGNGAQFVSNLIGFVYPAYASVKALRTDGKDDDTQWLIYWTTFASFFLVDSVGVVLLQYFPVYWVLKSMFLVYLYLLQTQGAIYLYEHVVDPAVTAIDNWVLKKFA